MRAVTHRYEDPLDRVWITCAERIGLRVVRLEGAYATTDGRGTLAIATPPELDADDSLAQMIFHELCHSLVQGPESFEQPDWGLDNESDRDVVREHACLRLQALLTRPLGLAGVLAPTTDFRLFWDALGPDPLAPQDDPSVPLARLASVRSTQRPWAPHLLEALHATAAIAHATAAHGAHAPGSSWSRVEPARPRHPTTELPLAAAGTPGEHETCGTCAWAARHGTGRRCLQAERPTRASSSACERWELATLDCQACGACCREAFDTLLLHGRERVARRHPELVVVRDDVLEIPRPGGRCPALEGDGSERARYACRVYDDRPRTCRDFTVGSANCLLARRRVGLAR
ncbi:YkgJ family cysteine cluster protein [Sandaracinus amylolyticus]|uniref:Uncharacterized protein n=1 Tax=Sandaracinus amylolyticus TaxID=927083 RepID=A0A0F6W4R4_9BACT|nr:YkgJ family cysteine cluster protein [Sandaracinus amylolyticus]AKF07367.1 Hypothetical protein DB32_004516 [Sandaracinus amylolyticus]